nr:MAG TPA: hypothetical protein [Caudoviricetes sp.]
MMAPGKGRNLPADRRDGRGNHNLSSIFGGL